MKKTYKIPAMEVVEIKTQQILMLSNLGETEARSGNLAPAFNEDFEDF